MNNPGRFIVTGGSGFIGSHFIRYLFRINPDYEVFNIDSLTYAADNKRLLDVSKNKNYHFLKVDIRNKKRLKEIIEETDPTTIFHFAAESHVDNSIKNPADFISTNIVGTYNLLDVIKTKNIKFVHISTDEIYGDRTGKNPLFTEESNYSPSSPYSATKASQEMLIRAYSRTYGLNAMILRLCNNYGPYQHREKFIPTCIINAIMKKPIPIYGKGRNRREWIFVEDTARAIIIAYNNFKPGAILNIGSGEIVSNLTIAKRILRLTSRDLSLIRFVKDRPGHDFCYGVVVDKMKRLGFSTGVSLTEGLRLTIDWYYKNIVMR